MLSLINELKNLKLIAVYMEVPTRHECQILLFEKNTKTNEKKKKDLGNVIV